MLSRIILYHPCLLVAALLFFAISASIVNADEKPALDGAHAKNMAAGLKLFNEHVREVFVNRCLDCHGGEETEGDFDISSREALLQGGVEGDAIKPGNAKASRLVRLIKHELAPEMPFDEAKLEDEEIAAIVKWIDLGAPYDKPLKGESEHDTPWTERVVDASAKDYWAFEPLKDISPPKTADASWASSPIDAFILHQLEERKISPNAPAAANVLVRRIYFDLIGIPPTPEELEKWTKQLGNNSAKVGTVNREALGEMVDELLASPHHGERWARHWLDVARFAESHGFEQDYDRKHAYHYRDFVIKALNQNLPYDQFVKWQIAGDEVAPDNPLALMATGFLGAGVFPTQLTEKEFESARYDELDDMVGTLGTSMLGLTIGCARCHDHKFDPIPQADYYRMVSTFKTTIRSEINIDLSSQQERTAARKKYDADLAKVTEELEAYQRDELPKRFADYVANLAPDSLSQSAWSVLDIVSHKTVSGTNLQKQPDGSLLRVGNTPAKDTYTVLSSTNQTNITAIRLEALTHESFPRKGPGLAKNGNFCLTDLQVAIRPVGSNVPFSPVKLTGARVTHEQDNGQLSAKASFDGDTNKTGWAVDRGGIGKNQAAIFVFDETVGFEGGTEFSVTLRFDHPNTRHALGRPRLSVTSADPRNVAFNDGESGIPGDIATTLAELKNKAPVRDDARRQALEWFAATLPEHQKLKTAVEKLRAAGPPSGKMTKVMVCSEGVPKMKHHADGRGFPHFYPKSYYLKRGDANQKQGEAPPAYLQVLMRGDRAGDDVELIDPLKLASSWKVEPPSGSKTSYRRRSLANWITDTDRGAGSLLARVIVNRVWHLHFGQGIVATPSDFGSQGEKPTHPELLEWLAADFIEHGWDLKRLHKQILTSNVYLQSSGFDTAKAKVDPENRLRWRFTPKRLEAEVIRDAMLAVSGELDRTMFGPGTLDERMKRRSIYFMIKRSKLIPMMQLFDQPEPLVSQGDRPATTIAPQALLFMNNPQVRSYSRALASRLTASADKSTVEAIRDAYLATLSREPTNEEVSDHVAFIEGQTASYTSEGKSNGRELALADFCQVMFCLNEFVFVE